MSGKIACCFEDQELEEAAELMENIQIRRLPVLDAGKKLVGIVSLGDVAIRGKNESCAGEIVGCVSESDAKEAQRKAISHRAYSLYVEHGAAPGHDVDDWTQAEKEWQQKERLAHAI